MREKSRHPPVISLVVTTAILARKKESARRKIRSHNDIEALGPSHKNICVNDRSANAKMSKLLKNSPFVVQRPHLFPPYCSRNLVFGHRSS